MHKLGNPTIYAVTKWMLAWMLITAPLIAQSRDLTYDLDIQVFISYGGPATPVPYANFAGSFVFNTNGTAFCSAAFCPAGAIPDFTNVSISDSLQASAGFTEVSGGGPLSFAEYYGGLSPPQWNSTFVAVLGIDVNENALEHGAGNIPIKSASYSIVGKGSFTAAVPSLALPSPVATPAA